MEYTDPSEWWLVMCKAGMTQVHSSWFFLGNIIMISLKWWWRVWRWTRNRGDWVCLLTKDSDFDIEEWVAEFKDYLKICIGHKRNIHRPCDMWLGPVVRTYKSVPELSVRQPLTSAHSYNQCTWHLKSPKGANENSVKEMHPGKCHFIYNNELFAQNFKKRKPRVFQTRLGGIVRSKN